ncbi:DUF6415 family natural product biosynthesis protein [Streptomyces sp. NPDC046465]|uniref:DUF6415 family natural product biosynthesis protein n=1 Tax=Streptomyces sp. NPDC046465 TaxID=3155810 RepID=UPI0033E346AC
MNATAATPTHGMPGSLPPVDVLMMRRATARLLSPEADAPSPDELDDLLLLLRGMIMLMIPEVETAAQKYPADDIPATCAKACIGEARMKLNVQPQKPLPARISLGQKLSRVLNALVDHHENLGGGHA